MEIELPEDLATQIANWLGIYEPKEPCPLTCGEDSCNNNDPFCCRMGVMLWLPDRIRQAVYNEEKLKELDLLNQDKKEVAP